MADASSSSTRPAGADLEDIQGLVYGAYSNHGYAGYVLARLDGGPERSRAWLDARSRPTSRRPRGTCARTTAARTSRCRRSASSRSGSRLLAGLPQEAKDGMASRARVLRDDPPETWELGGGPTATIASTRS